MPSETLICPPDLWLLSTSHWIHVFLVCVCLVGVWPHLVWLYGCFWLFGRVSSVRVSLNWLRVLGGVWICGISGLPPVSIVSVTISAWTQNRHSKRRAKHRNPEKGARPKLTVNGWGSSCRNCQRNPAYLPIITCPLVGWLSALCGQDQVGSPVSVYRTGCQLLAAMLKKVTTLWFLTFSEVSSCLHCFSFYNHKLLSPMNISIYSKYIISRVYSPDYGNILHICMSVVHLQCPQTFRPKRCAKRGNGGNHLSRFENITLPSRLFDVGWLGFLEKVGNGEEWMAAPAWSYFGASFHHTPKRGKCRRCCIAAVDEDDEKRGKVARRLCVPPRAAVRRFGKWSSASGNGARQVGKHRRHYQTATSVASERSPCVSRVSRAANSNSNLQLAIASNVPQPAATSNINCVFFWLWLWATSGFEFESRTLSFPRAFFSNRFEGPGDCWVFCFGFRLCCIVTCPTICLFVFCCCVVWCMSIKSASKRTAKPTCSICWTSFEIENRNSFSKLQH